MPSMTPVRPVLRASAAKFFNDTSSLPPRLILLGYTSIRAASTENDKKKERVVILGSGWAGYSFARSLDPKKYERILISPRSYFVFTPLVAGTAVGTLEFRATMEPVRRLGLDSFHQGWADNVDFAGKTVRVEANISDDTAFKFYEKTKQEQDKLQLSRANNTEEKPPQMFEVPYDKLVIAVGAYSQTFGIEGVKEHANFLRDVPDARRIRTKVLQAFERASLPVTTDEERRKLLHFAIVGGGPTGIEFAAELNDLIKQDLLKTYPDMVPLARITVYDVAPKVLPMFDQTLSSYAMDTFSRAGIRVKTQHHLTRIRPDDDCEGCLKLKIKEYGDEEVGASLVVWSTGLMQNPLVEKLGKDSFIPREYTTSSPSTQTIGSNQQALRIPKDPRTGGILTDSFLRVATTPADESNINNSTTPTPTPTPTATGAAADTSTKSVLRDVYAIGDCAVIPGASHPATAQVAAQKASHLAKVLNKTSDPSTHPPFKFHNWGTMTYLGSRNAIHQGKPHPLDNSPGRGLQGLAAWFLWRTAYLTRTVSLRNKIMVMGYWIMSSVFGRDISRF